MKLGEESGPLGMENVGGEVVGCVDPNSYSYIKFTNHKILCIMIPNSFNSSIKKLLKSSGS